MKASALGALISLFLLTTLSTVAQDSATAAPQQTGVVLVKLSPPLYPPLARQARIMGDVKIQVSIRKDGTVESAEVVSGHPILKQAALESAQKSQFECRQCGDLRPYDLMYTFAIDDLKGTKPDPCCCSRSSLPQTHFEPQINRSQDHVTVTVIAEPVCICPDECEERWAEEHSHYRALKCLYLWKCGFRRISIE
jgi:TonB family protein